MLVFALLPQRQARAGALSVLAFAFAVGAVVVSTHGVPSSSGLSTGSPRLRWKGMSARARVVVVMAPLLRRRIILIIRMTIVIVIIVSRRLGLSFSLRHFPQILHPGRLIPAAFLIS